MASSTTKEDKAKAAAPKVRPATIGSLPKKPKQAVVKAEAVSSNWKKLAGELQLNTSRKKRKVAAIEKDEEDKDKSSGKSKNKKQKTKDAEPAAAVDPTNLDDVWFDDVPKEDIVRALSGTAPPKNQAGLERQKAIRLDVSNDKIGKYVAIDCEFVGVGPEGSENALARVSIVNFHGNTVLDTFVRPQERVVDFRTAVSGVRPSDILPVNGAIEFKEAQEKVSDVITGRILVGHAVENDLQALMLDHPKKFIRDTTQYKPFRKLTKGRTPGLRKLAELVLAMTIQKGEHSSVEDAKTTMMLYRHAKDHWEKEIAARLVQTKSKGKNVATAGATIASQTHVGAVKILPKSVVSRQGAKK